MLGSCSYILLSVTAVRVPDCFERQQILCHFLFPVAQLHLLWSRLRHEWTNEWKDWQIFFFLLCFFFPFTSLMDHHNPNSHHPPSFFSLPFHAYPTFFHPPPPPPVTTPPSLLSPRFFPPPILCDCDSAPLHSFTVTAVHSPVPYCGAVHHLHAFSVLQRNEFLIEPNRRERSRKSRWFF